MEAAASPSPDEFAALEALLAAAVQRADEAEARLANAHARENATEALIAHQHGHFRAARERSHAYHPRDRHEALVGSIERAGIDDDKAHVVGVAGIFRAKQQPAGGERRRQPFDHAMPVSGEGGIRAPRRFGGPSLPFDRKAGKTKEERRRDPARRRAPDHDWPRGWLETSLLLRQCSEECLAGCFCVGSQWLAPQFADLGRGIGRKTFRDVPPIEGLESPVEEFSQLNVVECGSSHARHPAEILPSALHLEELSHVARQRRSARWRSGGAGAVAALALEHPGLPRQLSVARVGFLLLSRRLSREAACQNEATASKSRQQPSHVQLLWPKLRHLRRRQVAARRPDVLDLGRAKWRRLLSGCRRRTDQEVEDIGRL